jgi:histidinol dehydrogenase
MPGVITAFVVLAAVAICLQFVILFAIYMGMRKSQQRVDDLVTEVKHKGLPTLVAAHSFFIENGPKVANILDNVVVSTTTVKGQIERIDATVDDVIDRTRLQVIRTDELVTRTLDRIEEATDIVHHRVITPVRAVAGILRGVSAGIGLLVGRGRNGPPRKGPDGEMFI